MTAHASSRRPWPVPARPWIMRQTWRDLLFAHWPLPPEVLQPLLPPVLPLDLWEGQAWLGVVPFVMTDVSPRGVPSIPWLSAFPELNVRTYVTLEDKPGVYFFSLDAANPVAVYAARRWFNLPYFNARMAVQSAAGGFRYRSRRTHRRVPPAEFGGWYRPIGNALPAADIALADWLTARYCLYTLDRRGRVLRTEIEHPPWSLQPAEARIVVNTMTAPLGLHVPDTPPFLQFSRRLDVRVWQPERVANGEE
jgi:uncharacterized protein